MSLVDSDDRTSSFGANDRVMSQSTLICGQIKLLIPEHIEFLMDTDLHVLKQFTRILVVEAQHVLPLSHLLHGHNLREIVFLKSIVLLDVFKNILI